MQRLRGVVVGGGGERRVADYCSAVRGGGLGERTAVNVDPACSQQLSSTAKVARRPTGELRKKELMPHSTTTS